MGETSSASDVLIGQLSQAEIAQLWSSHIYPMLKDSNYSDMDPRLSIEDIGDLLIKDSFNLVAVVVDSEISALAVVYSVQEPQCKFGYVLLVCGTDLLKWGDKLASYLRQWFKNLGCEYVNYVSQPGWKRWDADSKPIGTLYLTKI